MAGDWIPMRLDLRDDPAVIFMAEKMGCREELVVGLCHTVWSWLSRNCHSGTVTNVSLLSLGRALNIGEFPLLLQECGWLKETKTTDGRPIIVVKGWERWLSRSAKSRMEAAQRKAAQRLMEKSQLEAVDEACHEPVTDMSHMSCDTSVTTEEDSTREKKDSKSKDIKPPYPPSPDGKGEDPRSIDADASRKQNPKPDRPKRDPKFDPIAATASEPWSPDLRSAWASWAAHRREKRSPLTPTMTKGLVDKFSEWGDKRAVAAIRHSIANGWQGLFEPEPGQAKPAEPPPPPRKTRFPEPPPKKGDWYRGHIPWDEVKEYDRECAWNGYWSAKDRWEVQQALAKEKAEEEAEAARIAAQKEHQGAA